MDELARQCPVAKRRGEAAVHIKNRSSRLPACLPSVQVDANGRQGTIGRRFKLLPIDFMRHLREQSFRTPLPTLLLELRVDAHSGQKRQEVFLVLFIAEDIASVIRNLGERIFVDVLAVIEI